MLKRMRCGIESRLHGRRAECVDFVGVQRHAVILHPLEGLDYLGIVRCHLASIVVHEAAAEREAVGVMPALVNPRHKAHLCVVAIAVLDIELICDLSDLVPGGRAVGWVKWGCVDTRPFDHPAVVIERADVGIER